MTTKVSIDVVGAKQAIIGLRKLDPELRKEFNRNVRDVVKPVVDEMKRAYPQMPLSGMRRGWRPGDRFQAFPYDQRRAQRGVRYKIDTSRKAVSIIRIQQSDPGTVIFETVGRRGSTSFSRRLSAFAGPATRVIWPAWEKNETRVQAEIRKLVLDAARTVEKGLDR